jgi:NAD(P)-dependent dehydrogenase (short-subunit alcohol dehydrogenase family)
MAKWTAANIPAQTGKLALITGSNSGLGFEAARVLAERGASVVLACRDASRAELARTRILADQPKAEVVAMTLDLADLDAIRSFAREFSDRFDRLDLLLNNAGVMMCPASTTKQGFEMQFGVNHLGHFALAAQLLPAVLRAERPRVVTVTSTAHHMGRPVDPANPHLHGTYGPWKAYGQSKLANFHFALGLQQRFAAAGLAARSLMAHPGLSNTELQATSVAETGGGFWQKVFHGMADTVGMSPAHGALPQLRAATDPEAPGGGFYGPRYVTFGPPVRLPVLRRFGLASAIDLLWAVSERETGTRLTVDAAAVEISA